MLFDENYGAFYKEMIDERKNEDYILNNEQHEKFILARGLFKTMCKQNKGALQAKLPQPKMEHADVCAELPCVSLSTEQMLLVQTTADIASAISVIPLTNGKIAIEAVIPYVYVSKQHVENEKMVKEDTQMKKENQKEKKLLSDFVCSYVEERDGAIDLFERDTKSGITVIDAWIPMINLSGKNLSILAATICSATCFSIKAESPDGHEMHIEINEPTE